MGYTGNKGVNDLYKNIINEFPPMRRYIEICLGSGVVARNLKPPAQMIGVEIDMETIAEYRREYPADMLVVPCDALKFLDSYLPGRADDLIYADPPYIVEETKCGKPLYRHSMSLSDHLLFLTALTNVRSRVVVSHYPCDVYDEMLKDWRSKEFKVSTRGGTAIEKIWMNFDEPEELHQYNFLGADKTERQRLKRKKERFLMKLREMEPKERAFLMDGLN